MRPRRRRVALLDWDNSIREGFTLVPWLGFLAEDDERRASAVRLADIVAGWNRLPPEIEYPDMARQAADICLASFEGRRLDDVATRTAAFFPTIRLRPGAMEFLRALVDAGIGPVFISGAPAEILRLHALHLGMDPDRDVHGWEMAHDGVAYRRALTSGNTAIAKRDLAERYRVTCTIVVGLGDDPIADLPLVEHAALGVWVDRKAVGESTRLTWTGPDGVAAHGSFADLAKVIGSLGPEP